MTPCLEFRKLNACSLQEEILKEDIRHSPVLLLFPCLIRFVSYCWTTN